jgi:hypothetical protein
VPENRRSGRTKRAEALVEPPPGAGRAPAGQARLVVCQVSDLVFDSKFLALKFGDPEFVGARSVLFYFDPMVQVGMFGLERFDSVQNGHCEPSFPAQIDDQRMNATPPRPVL